jgi:hypothetical protein
VSSDANLMASVPTRFLGCIDRSQFNQTRRHGHLLKSCEGWVKRSIDRERLR